MITRLRTKALELRYRSGLRRLPALRRASVAFQRGAGIRQVESGGGYAGCKILLMHDRASVPLPERRPATPQAARLGPSGVSGS